VKYRSKYYRVSGDVVSVLQDLIPEATSRQKCRSNIRPIFTATEVWVEIKDNLNDTRHKVLPA
jgi:hypothetical protein